MADKVTTRRKRNYRAREDEVRVDYARLGREMRTRFYQSEGAAEAFVRKVLGSDREDLAPVVYVEARKRKVGPWRSFTPWWLAGLVEQYERRRDSR